MFSAPDHNCHDEVSKESNWLSFGISRLPSNLLDLLVGFQRLQGRLWQCLKIIWDWSKIHLMHMLFYYPSRLLLTESPTVGVFPYFVWLSYSFLSRFFWAVDWLFLLLLCVSMSCSVTAVSKARCFSIPAGWLWISVVLYSVPFRCRRAGCL